MKGIINKRTVLEYYYGMMDLRADVAAMLVRCLLNCVGSGCYGVTCWSGSMGGLCHWFSVLRSITVVFVVVCIMFPSSSLVFLFGMVVGVVRCVSVLHIHVYC